MLDVPIKNTFGATENSLPLWIRHWLRDDFAKGDDAAKQRIHGLLKNVVSDPEVAKDLNRLCPDNREEKHATREQVMEWLTESCFVHQRSHYQATGTPGEAKEALLLIAKQSRNLAEMIFKNQALLGRSTSLSYLSSRLASDNPSGFVHKHRGGLGAAQRSFSPTELQDILEVFADDLGEEVKQFPARLDSLAGGEEATIRLLIPYLKLLYKSLFGRVNNVHVANVARSLTGIDVTADRVRKMRSLGGKN